MTNISEISLRDLLGMAARAEVDSNKLYAGLRDRVLNAMLKERFEFLASQEAQHLRFIQQLHGSLFREDPLVMPERADPALLPSVVVRPESTLAEIIFQAMTSERMAADFYHKLSERVEDTPKKIVEYLGRAEEGHYNLLRAEHSMALWYEDYAEKPIDKVVT